MSTKNSPTISRSSVTGSGESAIELAAFNICLARSIFFLFIFVIISHFKNTTRFAYFSLSKKRPSIYASMFSRRLCFQRKMVGFCFQVPTGLMLGCESQTRSKVIVCYYWFALNVVAYDYLQLPITLLSILFPPHQRYT